MPGSRRQPLALLAVALLALAIALTAITAPVAAGDNAAVYTFDPDDVEAEPGEQFDVDIIFSSHGDYGGEGVVDLATTVEYDDEVLSVVGVEQGAWLAGEDASSSGAEGDVETTVETDSGTVSIEQERLDAQAGVTGTAPVATLTVQIEESAEEGETTLEFTDSEAHTTAGQQFIFPRSGTVEITDESDSLTDSVPALGAAAAIAALLLLAVAARTTSAKR
ncbi:cohesin domain-containing protein [Halobacteria archaeon AArc-dxtr1]|nr:cohesin domain-containing protein [Halobacteria archaeon AArc-dxtr1]